jgi:immune inhibitor A
MIRAHRASASPAPACFVPPAPDLLAKIKTSRTRLFAGADLPAAATVDLLDMRTMTLLLGRPAPSRPHTFGAAPGRHRRVGGTRRVLALLVDFADIPARTPPTRFQTLLFGGAAGGAAAGGAAAGVGGFGATSAGFGATGAGGLGAARAGATRGGAGPGGSLRDYYHEVSYGKLTIDGLVSGDAGPTAGWYRAPQPKSFYANGNFGWGGYPNNSQRLVEDLVVRADPYVDFSTYDNDGDGVVDALVVISAGRGGEATGDSGDIWSHSWDVPTPIAVDGVAVSGYAIAAEDTCLGVLTHEVGHSLMHWPDLYDTDFASAGTGQWDLMAAGAWNGDGHRPAHPSGYCKLRAGWIEPMLVGGGTHAVTVRPYARRGDTYQLPVDPAGTEYFLVTNRQRTGFDDHLPGSGIIIEHVDESRTNNNHGGHYLVDIEQCDGRRDLNLGANTGDAADAYPSGGQTAFRATTTPSTASNAGADTGIAVTDIAVAANDLTAVITVGGDAHTTSVVGGWHLTVDWDDGDGPISAGTLHFDADGTWTYPLGGGRWVQVGGTIMWNCAHAPGLDVHGDDDGGHGAGCDGVRDAAAQSGLGLLTAGPAAAGGRAVAGGGRFGSAGRSGRPDLARSG